MNGEKPVVCPNCHHIMDPVELRNVPVEEIKNFLSVDGNKLEDNWYWCSECDSFEQQPIPATMVSPDTEWQLQELKSY